MNIKKIHLLAGWLVFAVALFVYLSTIEPTVSFWDCGEFIACAAKLQIGHQPGAPFFLILGRIFSILAGTQTDRIALMINSLSAIASAFTVMFLFKTIILLCERIFISRDRFTEILIPAGAFIGSMICTFSDTFWFSAVEGEVYATSSFFTAFVFWAMLKWAKAAGSPETAERADKWMILIIYLMGLSIGVHLLNLLCIPALMAIFYFTKYNPSVKGFLFSQILALMLLGMIVFVLIPGVIKFAAGFDLLFVNGLNLPINSGALFYLIVLVSVLIILIRYSHTKGKIVLNKILIAVAVFLTGYSSYVLLPVRASANPPINLNHVDNPFSLLQYIGREQYVSRPLMYGPYYNAPVKGYKERFSWVPVEGRYEKRQVNGKYIYNKKNMTLFPRMSSSEAKDAEGYKKWAVIKGKQPTFGDNLKYFFRYQVGYMYWRYFMWNFAGRQNENQGTGDIMNGNWISGIPFLDKIRLGSQVTYPEWLRSNKGRNEYYLLPLLLGIAGLAIQYKKHQKDFISVLLFFFFTGLAIVIYLNEIPVTPRERDYAVGGSFYVFCIWTGMGTIALARWLRRRIHANIAAVLAIALSLLVPALMAKENYDDHNRSRRFFARDMAFNYLNSCDNNAILFTNADNDTYPLWYAQEVEGIRTDVRVILAPFLTADWYLEDLANWHNNAPPVDLIIDIKKYTSGDLNNIPYYKRTDDPVPIAGILEFMGSDDPRAMIRTSKDTPTNYYPSNKILLFTETTGIRPLPVILNDYALPKHLIAALDIIAANYLERPVYFLSTQLPSELGLTDYLQADGFAYKLIPEKFIAVDEINTGKIDTYTLYDKLMNKFIWGNMNDPGVFLDNNCIRTTHVLGIRNLFARLAESLLQKGENEKAIAVLDRCMELTPHRSVPYDYFNLRIISAYLKAGAHDKAEIIINDYKSVLQQEIEYFALLKPFEKRQLRQEITYTQYIVERIREMEMR